MTEYWYSRWLFERALAAIYLIAFAAAAVQFVPLLGERGLEPVGRWIAQVPFRQSPSLFYLFPRDQAFRAAAWLGIAAEADRRPDRMSGGQRQRVAIARALANDPALILGDEPTGNLDSANTQLVIEEFQRLAHEEGRAVVCVTHDADVAAAADRRIRMKDGQVVGED